MNELMEALIDDKIWYFCDPQKNTPCSKSGCALYGGECYTTSKREYSLLDSNGEPRIERIPLSLNEKRRICGMSAIDDREADESFLTPKKK